MLRYLSRIVLQQALYLHGGFGHTIDGGLWYAQVGELRGYADSLCQLIDEVDAALGRLFVVGSGFTPHCNSHLGMTLYVGRHVKLQHGGQEDGIRQPMWNMELTPERVGEGMYGGGIDRTQTESAIQRTKSQCLASFLILKIEF